MTALPVQTTPRPRGTPHTPATAGSPGEPVQVIIGPGCAPELRAELTDGGMILVLGANSDKDGLPAARAAAQTLHSALELLAVHGEVDATAGLPDAETLAQRLRSPRGNDLDAGLDLDTNRPLKARVLVEPLGPRLWMHLSTGSRAKLGDQTRSNPVTDDIADTLWAHNIRLLALHEGTRMLRTVAGAARIIGTLDALHKRNRARPWVYLGDDEPPEQWSKRLRKKIIELGEAGEEEIERFNHRSGSGIRAKVGARFNEGRVAFGTNNPPPPGADLATLRPPLGRGKPLPIAYLDEPGSRPASTEVQTGWLAEDAIRGIVDQADQVALICWFLRHVGRPGWGYEECADYLLAHGYRTAGLLTHGEDPTAGFKRRTENGHSLARNICHTILEHLEEYLTETIVLRGKGIEGKDLKIVGFRPSSGPWLTLADYDRITDFLAATHSKHRNTAGYGFARWPVKTPLGPAELVARDTAPWIVFYLQDPVTRRRIGTRADRFPPLSHAALARSIVLGLIDHVDALRPLLRSIDDGLDADRARAQVLEQQNPATAHRPGEIPAPAAPADRPRPGRPQQGLQRPSRPAQGPRGRARRGHRSGSRPPAGRLRGLAAHNLLRFARAVRDPRDVRFRAALLDGSIAFRIWTETRRHGRRSRVRVLCWAGTAAVHDRTGSWTGVDSPASRASGSAGRPERRSAGPPCTTSWPPAPAPPTSSAAATASCSRSCAPSWPSRTGRTAGSPASPTRGCTGSFRDPAPTPPR